MRSAARERYREGAAMAQGALQAQLAAVQFHQFLHQSQSNAGSLVGSRPRILHSVKALKYPLLFFFRDTDARITDREFDRTIRSFQRDGDFAFECEFERVRKKIQDHLLPHLAIYINGLVEWLAFHLEAKP